MGSTATKICAQDYSASPPSAYPNRNERQSGIDPVNFLQQ